MPAPAPTPTNHTTRAYFGGLEVEESDEDDDDVDSGDEQTSIDCSQLIDPSSHTHKTLTSELTSTVNESSNINKTFDAPNNHNGNNSSDSKINDPILSSIVEEEIRGSRGSESRGVSSTPAIDDNPLEDPQRSQDKEQQQVVSQKQRGSPTLAPNTASTPMIPSYPSNDDDDDEKSNMDHAPSVLLSVAPSVTLHASNVDAIAYQKMEEESERNVAWAIHAVLGCFCGLILLSTIMTFLIVENYGLVAMMGSILVVCFMVFLMWFIDYTILRKTTQFRPIRRKIIRVIEIAKQAMVEEFQLFKRDWNEHFLLTNGTPMDDDEVEDEEAPITNPVEQQRRQRFRIHRKAAAVAAPGATAHGGLLPGRTKKRSVVFQALKSSFQMGRRVLGRGRKKATCANEGTTSTSNNTTSSATNTRRGRHEPRYHPPNADNGVIAK